MRRRLQSFERRLMRGLIGLLATWQWRLYHWQDWAERRVTELQPERLDLPEGQALPTQDEGPPAHWAELVRRRAPWLLQRPPLRRPARPGAGPPGVADAPHHPQGGSVTAGSGATPEPLRTNRPGGGVHATSEIHGVPARDADKPVFADPRTRKDTAVHVDKDETRREVSSTTPLPEKARPRVGRVSVVTDDAEPPAVRRDPSPSPSPGARRVGPDTTADTERGAGRTKARGQTNHMQDTTSVVEPGAASLQARERTRESRPHHDEPTVARPARDERAGGPFPALGRVVHTAVARRTDEPNPSSDIRAPRGRSEASAATRPLPSAEAPLDSSRRPVEETTPTEFKSGSWPSLPDEHDEEIESGRWPDLPGAPSGHSPTHTADARDHDRRLRLEQEGLGWNA